MINDDGYAGILTGNFHHVIIHIFVELEVLTGFIIGEHNLNSIIYTKVMRLMVGTKKPAGSHGQVNIGKREERINYQL